MQRAVLVLSAEQLKRVLNLPESVVITGVCSDVTAGTINIGVAGAGYETAELGVPMTFRPNERAENGRTLIDFAVPLTFTS